MLGMELWPGHTYKLALGCSKISQISQTTAASKAIEAVEAAARSPASLFSWKTSFEKSTCTWMVGYAKMRQNLIASNVAAEHVKSICCPIITHPAGAHHSALGQHCYKGTWPWPLSAFAEFGPFWGCRPSSRQPERALTSKGLLHDANKCFEDL